jgi:hypothetical protein
MPTRCNRIVLIQTYSSLNMFRALLCPSSGAQNYTDGCGMWYITMDGNSVINLKLFYGLWDKINLQNDPYNKNQQDALIYFQFISIINLYMFGAGLLLIIRRYYSVYIAVGICNAFMLTGCWQDPFRSCQQPVKINTWHIPIAVYTE